MTQQTEHLLKIKDDVTELKVIATKNSSILEQNSKDIAEHIRRTNLLQDGQQRLEKRIEQVALPWKILKLIAKIVSGGFAIAGVIFTLVQILQTAGLIK